MAVLQEIVLCNGNITTVFGRMSFKIYDPDD